MDKSIIPVHEDELPDQIDVTLRINEFTREYDCIFRWDDDGYADRFELHSPSKFGLVDPVKLFGQALIDNGYSCISDLAGKRSFRHDTDLPNYYVQLGRDGLGLG